MKKIAFVLAALIVSAPALAAPVSPPRVVPARFADALPALIGDAQGHCALSEGSAPETMLIVSWDFGVPIPSDEAIAVAVAALPPRP